MDLGKDLQLNTGSLMPRIGLGTWKLSADTASQAVTYALGECGYRHIDCAAAYGNESEIGSALKKLFDSGKIQRGNIFVTSKLWNTAHGKKDVRNACEKTLKDLRLEYLDLYLMHWGVATSESHWAVDAKGVLKSEKITLQETWEAMENLVRDGLVKAIGVANFTAPMLMDMLAYATIPPAINQIELHPYLQQSRLVEFCQERGVNITAYSPLGRPGAEKAQEYPLLTEDATIRTFAARHGKTAPQVLLRWGIQRNTVVIPKSSHPERIKENIDIFDFELSREEVQEIAGLERHLRLVDMYDWAKIPYFD
jgi:alcohol dehydrogenase (NADP+)